MVPHKKCEGIDLLQAGLRVPVTAIGGGVKCTSVLNCLFITMEINGQG